MVINFKNALHYTWGHNCDGWHLLNTQSLSVIQERMPPGTFEVRHYHNHAQQLFYILSGTAAMYLEDEKFILNAGDSIHIEKGKIHQLKNESTEELGFLVISEPKAHGDKTTIE